LTPGVTLGASLAVALVVVAALVGWQAPGAPPALSLSVARHGGARADIASLQKPGGGYVADVDALEADLAVAPSARPAPPPPPRRIVGLTPAPVAHDVAPVFRGRASAIVRLPTRQLAVLLAAGPGEARSRLLRVGDLFDDRWRLTALTMNEATLADGTSVERVPLFGEAVGAQTGGEPQ
jgi:hypothetical protein